MENKNKILASIEALLFVYGEPLEIKRIAKILKTESEKVKSALDDLAKSFENEDRGLKLIFSGDKVQLATKPELSSLLEDFIKEEFKESLTPAALETLSLIAYLAPISRSQIDYYRGVNSSFIVRSLLIRGLIDRSTDPKRGNVYLYEPSFDLLKYLGISKEEDLPEYDKFKTINKKQETLSPQ
jgi:segregation and condensation protein B